MLPASNATPDGKATENPFPGLRPFEFDEAYLFFGRDQLRDDVLRRLRCQRFVAVIGTSGSGKSSLIRAGLLVALYGGDMVGAGSRWRHAIMRPGNRPIGNLADALTASGLVATPAGEAAEGALDALWLEATLRASGRGLVDAVRQAHLAPRENLLIVVDQMEELFRFGQSQDDARDDSECREDEAAAFIKLLLEAVGQNELPIYVVITMRSDYIGDCARFHGLPEAVNEGLYLIPRMTREQRKEAIVGPVAVSGATIAPRLVNRLLNDVGEDPDQLPILQHALMRIWDLWQRDHADREPLDLRHYLAIGSLSQALSDHAEEAYAELPDDRHREIARQLFQLLTEKGPDNREVRRPVTIREIAARTGASLPEILLVIEVFRRPGRSFLTSPTSGPLSLGSEIDISHESLIRGWKTLKQWVDEEADSAREYRRLADTAARHAVAKADFLHDPDLGVMLKWRETQQPTAVWASRYHEGFAPTMAFLDASAEARDKAAAAADRQRTAALRQARRRLAVTGSLGVIALGLAGLAGVMLYKANDYAQESQKEVRRGVDYARNVMFEIKALPDDVKRQREVLKFYESQLNAAQRFSADMMHDDPDNQDAMLLWAQCRTSLPDLLHSQGLNAEAQKDCANILREEFALGKSPHYMRRTVSAYMMAACADTLAQLDLKQEAMSAADRAFGVAETLWSEASPTKAHWRLLSNAYALAASVHGRYQKKGRALQEHRQSVASRRNELAALAPPPLTERAMLVAELQAQAQLEAEQESHEQAVKTLTEASKYAEAWAAAAPRDQGLIDLVFFGHILLGDALLSWAELPQAEREYSAARSWAERMTPATLDGEFDHLVVDERFGNLWRSRSTKEKDSIRAHQQLTQALEFHDKALARNLNLRKTDASVERQRSLAISESNVGDDFRQLKDFAAARAHQLASIEAYRQAAQLEPGEAATNAYADAYHGLANVDEDAGDFAAAHGDEDKAVQILRPLATRAGSSPEMRKSLAESYGNLSWFDLLQGNFAQAVLDADTGLGVDGSVSWILTNKAHGYLLSGRVEEARTIYLANAGRKLSPSQSFNDAVLDDFKKFRAKPPKGLNLAAVEKMEMELKAR